VDLSQPRGYFADQFEVNIYLILNPTLWADDLLQNRSNFDAHYLGTGPEIWRQTSGHVDAFIAGAGKLQLISL
jgi:cysteine synthase A